MQIRGMLVVLGCAAVAVGAAETHMIYGRNGVKLPAPPATEAKPVTENVNGTTIVDPYRWLEDGKSAETRAWITSQIKYTDEYMSQVKVRPEIGKQITELVRAESYSVPIEREGSYFFTKRLAEENQASIYVRRGLHGSDEKLVDALKLSADQNTSVHINDVSKAGDLLVYDTREGGADEQEIRLVDVAKRQALGDVLPRARYLGVSLAPDNKGLYYSRLEAIGTIVYYHKLGTAPESDQLIFGKEFNGEKLGAMELIQAGVTENGRYLLIEVDHGVPATRADIYIKELREADGPIRPIIHGIENRFQAENYGDDLYVLTDYQAERYRVIKIDLKDAKPQSWKTLVPESKDVMSAISIVGGKLFVTGLHDVVTQTKIYQLDGKAAGELKYPTLGSASAVFGLQSSANGFYTFESFIIPHSIYHYDVKTGKAEIFAKPQIPFDSEKYEVKQVFYASKDGTKVPMFIVAKRGLKADGSAPALMTAYGGFNISLTGNWNPEYAWWIEQGGIFAMPNLRGGGEYGEAWHKAGMFEKKQNVFDDFFAAAEYLISNKYTTAERLAIRGRSNGGLLMGAAITQRPELFGAIWCGYPLLDMIRYQNFLIGKWWTTEYGSAENAQQFPYIYKYSPYQNMKKGLKYPAIMFFTGDSDTRVDPLHARKMTALMQTASGSERPILLHYDLKAGHSAGVSIAHLVDDTSDELAFLWNETSGK